jgi:hypothetical protein
VWGTNWFKGLVNPWAIWNYPVPDLHNMINKVAPIVPRSTPEAAVFSFTWPSYTGTGMLIAAIISGLLMGFSPIGLIAAYGRTIKVCAYSLITISAMLAIGTLTRLSGIDATLVLAFAATGVLYPFFGTLLGWLGVHDPAVRIRPLDRAGVYGRHPRDATSLRLHWHDRTLNIRSPKLPGRRLPCIVSSLSKQHRRAQSWQPIRLGPWPRRRRRFIPAQSRAVIATA